MWLWSVHPQYLDSKGLVALWREALLAKAVLLNKTKGYKKHPQLQRFQFAKAPIKAIDFYLQAVWLEANKRQYQFDQSKFTKVANITKIEVSNQQVAYEKNHLLTKLKNRDLKKYNEIKDIDKFKVHPLFQEVTGEIEKWEKLS